MFKYKYISNQSTPLSSFHSSDFTGVGIAQKPQKPRPRASTFQLLGASKQDNSLGADFQIVMGTVLNTGLIESLRFKFYSVIVDSMYAVFLYFSWLEIQRRKYVAYSVYYIQRDIKPKKIIQVLTSKVPFSSCFCGPVVICVFSTLFQP